MSARWWTFTAWALVAASALFWGLKLFVRPSAVPAHAQVATAANAARGDLTRLLGVDAKPPSAAPAPAAEARFQLIGVVTPRSAAAAREGLALIAVDGKPPKAFRVGTVVEGQTVLKSVAPRGATLGPRDGADTMALALAPPAPAATGMLPNLGMTPTPPAVVPSTAPPGTPPTPRRLSRPPTQDTAPGAPSPDGAPTQ